MRPLRVSLGASRIAGVSVEYSHIHQLAGEWKGTARGSPRIFRKEGGAEAGATLTLLSLETGENRPGYPRTRGRGLDEASQVQFRSRRPGLGEGCGRGN